MKLKTALVIFASTCAAALPLSAATVFSNDFEDNNLAPEVGTWTFAPMSATTAVVPTSVAPDPTLGNYVGLIDQDATETNPLGLTLNLTSTVLLTGGNTVTLDFDIAARRTAGNSKTIFVDALDSDDFIVARFVLGDSNAFGNAGGDRQRPGYDSTSAGDANTGNTLLPAPGTPGSFWWGSDFDTATFDVGRDAHMSLTYSASSFTVSTTSQAGVNYTTPSALGNRDGGTFNNIASIRLTTAGTNYGFYLDNIVVEGTLVPEPSSALLFGFAGLGFLFRRKR